MLAAFALVSVTTGSDDLGAVAGGLALIVTAYLCPLDCDLVVLHGTRGADPA